MINNLQILDIILFVIAAFSVLVLIALTIWVLKLKPEEKKVVFCNPKGVSSQFKANIVVFFSITGIILIISTILL